MRNEPFQPFGMATSPALAAEDQSEATISSGDAILKLSEPPELASMDQSLALSRARLAALNLMEGAISARARAEDISHELQQEIDNRRQTEATLVDTERRYRRVVEAIGDVYWLSTADWQTILYFDPSESPIKTGQRPSRSSHG